ncbi:peptidase S8/S53 domain-containing protein [Lasiosphaeris hirsuta]|uniref:Peptidase S8/S53 domain-containing protein n=1 Tax=Lasiosphaeris hirsuta TaxID=260670 RepID=A0AA40E591_9PEZI|nr:peptidase S8/S53 domain-containing protein [Lasiosphaeris hirsuta]
MLLRKLAIAAALTSGIAAGFHSPGDRRTVPTTHQVHERQDAHWSTRWEKGARVQPRTVLPVRIGLTQRNLEAGERLLSVISDPTSSNYGKHLSAEEVISMFAPSDEAIDAVRAWLVGAGFAADSISLSANKQWVQFDARAADVEDLLATDFFEYQDRRGISGRAVAAEAYHVPLELQQHVDYITPGIRLRAEPALEPEHGRRSWEPSVEKGTLDRRTVGAGVNLVADVDTHFPLLNSTACDYYLTTACIRAQYQIPNNTLSTPGNEVGIFASLNDHYSRANLDTFFTTLYPGRIPNGTYPEERLINGAIGAAEDVPGLNSTTNGGESDLDLQAAWPLIYPQRAVIFQTDDQYYETEQTTPDTPYSGFWNTFYDALDGSYCTFSAFGETGDCTEPECLDPMYPNPNDQNGYQGPRQCGAFTPTKVISISYSGGEADFPASYLRRQCAEIMKLALQGVTVVESSGDSGVAGYEGDPRLANGCAGESGRVFYPSADVTCPYVLAVGATRLNHTSPNSTTYFETAWEYSGGGFSNYFDAPPWQKRAVGGYFSSVRLNFTGYESPGENFSHVGQGVYRKGGRGYPDVAAMGRGYFSFTEGKWSRQGGTSLSAPLWAAVLTLVNERRLAAGKSTVGLVHPVLYAHPEVFADVTQGANLGCNMTGFPAARGWDPVTGLGTPIFPKLVDVFLQLP